MEKQVTRLAPRPRLEKKKRVAAYARVSSGKDAMLHSLAEQVSYYSDLIRKEPGWIFAGVYADEAYTGTKEARPEFQRLLGDCRNGTVDMVITKSISRFARNTVTLLETVRELKELGVDVSAEEIVQAERDLRVSLTEVNVELSPEDLDKAAGGYWWAADDSPIDGHELFCIFTWHDSSWSKEHDDWCTKNYIFKKWVQN